MDQNTSEKRELYLVERSLAEQLKISDHEIAYRKKLFGIDNSVVQTMKECKELVLENINDIIDRFYDNQKSIKEVELLIGDMETFNRLHASMKRYVIELFEGFYDREYINNRLRIGKVHKLIGVSPKLYMSAIVTLERIILEYIMEKPACDGCGVCDKRRQALHQILMFDVQLVFDTYINSMLSEVEVAKAQVVHYAEELEDIVQERTQQLEDLARKDMLTGLFNQRYFYEQLRIEISRAERGKQELTLVYFDLNNFKKLNDSKGHKAGDALLSLVGETLRQELRQIDMAFRYGGDEFCVLMPATGNSAAEVVCQRFCDNFDKMETQGVSFSFGLAGLKAGQYLDMDQLVKNADKAMYEAKAISRQSPGHQLKVFMDEEQESLLAPGNC